MSTFLELCQKVARDSGTVSGTLPSAVTSQSGRLAKVVYWTAEAWRIIQNRRSAWLWMRAEYEKNLVAGTARYTASGFALTRWAEWIVEKDTVTIYEASVGVSDEQPLVFMPWTTYRRTFERGTQTADRPRYFSVSPAGELCFGPKPDVIYTVRGEYRKTVQELAANTDEPEMPARFHDLVAHYGFLLLAEHDEAGLHIEVAQRRYRELMSDLERDQLPTMSLPDALA